jgi:hypothetical protein
LATLQTHRRLHRHALVFRPNPSAAYISTGPEALGRQIDDSIAALRHAGARVIGGAAGAILYVAALSKGSRRDARVPFAAS